MSCSPAQFVAAVSRCPCISLLLVYVFALVLSIILGCVALPGSSARPTPAGLPPYPLRATHAQPAACPQHRKHCGPGALHPFGTAGKEERGGGYNDIHRELIDKPNDIATMLGASAEACYTFWHRIAKKPSKPGSLIRAGLVA